MYYTVLFLAFILAVGVTTFLVSWWRKRKRYRVLRQFAGAHGFEITEGVTPEALKVIPGSNIVASGYRVAGTVDGFPITIVDCHDQSTNSRGKPDDPPEDDVRQTTLFTCRLPGDLPDLALIPTGFGSVLSRFYHQSILGDEVELDATEFAEVYHVRCNERKFAYDFCHHRLMQHLIDGDHRMVLVRGDRLVLYIPFWPDLDGMERGLGDILALRRLVPEWLLEDRASATARQASEPTS